MNYLSARQPPATYRLLLPMPRLVETGISSKILQLLQASFDTLKRLVITQA